MKPLVYIAGLADTAMNWVIERCVAFDPTASVGISIVLPTSASADYDSAITIRNSQLCARSGVQITSTGAGAFKGGGILVHNCTIIATVGASGAGIPVLTVGTNISTTIPCKVYNCILMGGAIGLVAGASGQILSNFNRNMAGTARTNVTVGANDIEGTAHSPLLEVGQAPTFGRTMRPFLQPMAGSPLLGFGSDGSVSLTVDQLNRPRPAGGASASKAVGALERGNSFVKQTGTVHAGSAAWSIVGPGYEDIQIPVDAVSTQITRSSAAMAASWASAERRYGASSSPIGPWCFAMSRPSFA